MRDVVKLDLTKLEKVQENLLKNFIVKVGILGSKDNREEGDSNASIGLKHEFGSASEGIPERSFLRAPLIEKIPESLKEIGQDYFDSLTNENIENFFEKLGIKGEEIIQEGFDTGGFGKWPSLSPKTIEKKGFDSILIGKTVQLRNSIISEVVKDNGI
jgi:hypothetical protein